jgi:hypothetical protein
MNKKLSRTNELRKESGKVTSNDELVAFLYVLMRDHLPCGQVEQIIQDNILAQKEEKITFSNGYLANYAKNLANILRRNK